MNVVIHPKKLAGQVVIPSSKSYAHRLLIAAALADRPTEVRMNAVSSDIAATVDCLISLGAKIERIGSGYSVSPIDHSVSEQRTLFCSESGSTLRFLLPVAAALGADCTFTGTGRLPERPNAILTDALQEHGVHTSSSLLPITISGKLTGGKYSIAGNVSSQYITGLLFALPLCSEDSEIALTTPLESAPYIDITLEVLSAFGIRIERTGTGWLIPGGQQYHSPETVCSEGDWSGAAFWLAANRLGSSVKCLGLNPASCQGDRAIAEMLHRLGGEIDVSATPDLVPALAAAAALYPGITRITGAARLRIKESDRLFAVADMLRNLGGNAEILEDGLVVTGVSRLTGGTVKGYNDHRIVMAAAIAAACADAPVTITDAQAVNKSYPSFFEHFIALGGNAYVEPNR